MTLTSTIKSASGPAGIPDTSRRRIAIELSETFKLSVPIALTQLGQIAMMTTDLALIGRLGDQAVAAAALAHTIFFISFTIGMGLVSAVAPLAAQAVGARNPRMVRRALRVGLWAALLIAVPLMALPFFGEHILTMLGQAPDTARLAQRYLLGLTIGIIPALWFMAIRNFMGAVNRPEPGLWITLAAIPANALLGYALIHGHWGLPRLELFGAGIATTIVNFCMCAAALWFCYSQRPFKKFRVLGRFWRIDWTLMRRLFVIGAPISMAFLMEYGLFGAAALLMGTISTMALAAHQVALQVTAILFMIPFGIGMAATVRVGQAAGRKDAAAVGRAGFVAVALGMAILVALTLAVILARYPIARLFFGDAAQSSVVTVELTATLLLVGATFFIADGIQTIAAGSIARFERYACAAAVVRLQLLGDRVHGVLRAGVLGRLGRGRRLDRTVLRHRRLLRFAHPSISKLRATACVCAMKVHAIPPDAETKALLPGAQFADAFRIATDNAALNARQAAERMLGSAPRWIDALMKLRNAVVAPLGLKTPSHIKALTVDSIGAFPVISETPGRIIAGFDDRHLDFRVIVDVVGAAPDRRVTATTLVLTHNLLGRAYLATIMPFHRIIVPALLRQIAG